MVAPSDLGKDEGREVGPSQRELAAMFSQRFHARWLRSSQAFCKLRSGSIRRTFAHPHHSTQACRRPAWLPEDDEPP